MLPFSTETPPRPSPEQSWAQQTRPSNSPGSPSPPQYAVQPNESMSDTHHYIGPHSPETDIESSTSSSRCRPGFNIYRPLEEEVSFTSCDSACSTDALIDNTVLLYIPMKLKCGVNVYCRPDVLARCPRILRDLHHDIRACLEILPPSVHALVRRTKIWVNTTYYWGPREKPRNVNHSTAHHHEGWLFWFVKLAVFTNIACFHLPSYRCSLR